MSKSRTNSGRIPQKRADTLVRTIEKKYDVDLGVRSDMKLGKFLKDNGFPSLSKALNQINKEQKRKK